MNRHGTSDAPLAVASLWKLRSFGTFNAATTADEKTARTRRARAESANLRGRLVEGFEIDDVEVRIRVSGGQTIRIWLGSNAVTWSVQADAKNVVVVADDPWYLKFADGPVFEWSRVALLEQLIGKPFKALAPSESALSVYAERAPDIRFSGLVQRDTGKPLLFFAAE